MKADLHLHTTASDGRFSPEEIVHLAARQGLKIIAITDHDSVDGVRPALAAARDFPSLKVIPGVEISTDIPHGEVHVLGYFMDYADREFKAALERLRNSRRERAQRMVAKLRDMGIHIKWERVEELAGGGSFGRPHIAQAMFERGYVSSFQEAFTKYIGRDGPAYVEREKMTPAEVVGLIVKAGGLAVLAHPANIDRLEGLLLELERAGLVGIEAYYNGYAPEVVQGLVSIANKHRLIPCGGSDYHGLGGDAETMIGGVEVPSGSVKRLLALAEQGAHSKAGEKGELCQ